MLNPEKPPEIEAARWFNTPGPIRLGDLKGKVVVLATFQLHCPGSLKHGLPQAERLAANFSDDEVAVIALNTAFEEHGKQTADALEAFVAEQKLSIPVAQDKPNGDSLPKTFEAYELQGTPAILIFDRQGRLRRHYLGQVDDVRLGAEIMALVIEARDAPREQSIAVERRLAAALVDPNAHHHHDHEGGCCGGHHHHDHGHAHDHEHDHGHACGCGHEHGHAHDHEHAHGHDHTHEHAHGHAHSHGDPSGGAEVKAKSKAKGKTGSGSRA